METMNELASLREKVKPLYEHKDPAHRFDHIQRIMRFCEETGSEVGADIPYLLSSALFHGLKSYAYDEVLCEKLKGGYELYRETAKKASRNPETIEEKLIHDANLFDALGILGIARSFTKGGFENQTIDITVKKLKENMKRPLLTEIAREKARPRIRIMEEFLSRLEEEMKT